MARMAALALLLGAILPNVSFIGHWGAFGGAPDPAAPTHASHDPLGPAEAEQHARHCHVGPARCSGQSSLVGTWSIGDATSGLLIDGSLALIELSVARTHAEPPRARIAHPPKSVPPITPYTS